jgi:hypothetical protein
MMEKKNKIRMSYEEFARRWTILRNRSKERKFSRTFSLCLYINKLNNVRCRNNTYDGLFCKKHRKYNR